MHEFQTHKFMWFCVQNWEFLTQCQKFGSWWQLWWDEAEKTPEFQELKSTAVISLCWAVSAIDCTTDYGRFTPDTTNACGLVGLCKLVLPPPVNGGISLWTCKRGVLAPACCRGEPCPAGRGVPAPAEKQDGAMLSHKGSCNKCYLGAQLWMEPPQKVPRPNTLGAWSPTKWPWKHSPNLPYSKGVGSLAVAIVNIQPTPV